jgi:hypothetical protein
VWHTLKSHFDVLGQTLGEHFSSAQSFPQTLPKLRLCSISGPVTEVENTMQNRAFASKSASIVAHASTFLLVPKADKSGHVVGPRIRNPQSIGIRWKPNLRRNPQ